MRRESCIAVFVLFTAGCVGAEAPVGDPDESFLADGKADAFGLVDGSPEAIAVLDVVNTYDVEELDGVVALDARAARNIVDARPIGTLEELDAVPWVGRTAFNRLVTFVFDQGLVDYPISADVHGWVEDSPEAILILAAANKLSAKLLDEHGLDTATAGRIEHARFDFGSFESLAALDTVPGVGARAFQILHGAAVRWGYDSWSPSNPRPTFSRMFDPTACDGTPMTQAQAVRRLEDADDWNIELGANDDSFGGMVWAEILPCDVDGVCHHDYGRTVSYTDVYVSLSAPRGGTPKIAIRDRLWSAAEFEATCTVGEGSCSSGAMRVMDSCVRYTGEWMQYGPDPGLGIDHHHRLVRFGFYTEFEESAIPTAPAPTAPPRDVVLGFSEGSYSAGAILGVANRLDNEELDHVVGLDARAARGITEHRYGADGVESADDLEFDSLAELANIPWVGQRAFELMESFGRDNSIHWTPGGATVLPPPVLEGMFDPLGCTTPELGRDGLEALLGFNQSRLIATANLAHRTSMCDRFGDCGAAIDDEQRGAVTLDATRDAQNRPFVRIGGEVSLECYPGLESCGDWRLELRQGCAILQRDSGVIDVRSDGDLITEDRVIFRY